MTSSLNTLTTLELVCGRLVVRKVRTPATTTLAASDAGVVDDQLAEARAATDAEGRWLRAARHSGVVALSMASVDRCYLETIHAGVFTLRTGTRSPSSAAQILASVATTIGDLHQRGLVHGALSIDQVVLGGPGLDQARLCGPNLQAVDPLADVLGLQTLARQVLDLGLASANPAERRLWRRAEPRWLDAIHALAAAGQRQGPTVATRSFERLAAVRRTRRTPGMRLRR